MAAEPNALVPEVQILVACMNRREPPPVLAQFPPGAERPALLVINQCTEIEPPPERREPGLHMVSVRERGLARSRNRALDLARGELLAFCDEDVEYLPSALATLRGAFAAHPETDIATFQVLERASGRPFKRYASRSHDHGPLSIGSVTSMEIAFRRSRAGQLRLDERFGLGTALPSGEENIWLMDALRSGLKARYFAEPLCTHLGFTSGHRAWSESQARAKGALLRRMYPMLWPAMALGFGVLKYPLYREHLSAPRFMAAALRGARDL